MPAVRFAVRLTPRGGADGIDGVDADGALLVRVRAAPVDGAANEALRRLLAKALGVPTGAVTLAAGAAGRRKRIEVADRGAADLRERWPSLAVVDAQDRATG
ncbi:MAG: DUF167 domain-containing protein [Candidatus Limnocylindrales bacterium]